MNRLKSAVLILAMTFSLPQLASAWDLNRIFSAGVKAVQAATISDAQIQQYVHEYIQYEDKKNTIADPNSTYAKRLANLTSGLDEVDGIPLNFKVYITKDVNAFACADGSVRVFSGLMDLMNDNEVLGVIGHEIGHVAHKDTKNAFKNSLLMSALRDGVSSAGGVLQTLSDSQLGALSESLVNAKYSQKQETNADNYGYEFLKSHGKNPWAMAMAFAKLGQLESSGNTSNGLAQLFSSHPDTGKRIKNIIKKCEKDHIAPPADYLNGTSNASGTSASGSAANATTASADTTAVATNSAKTKTIGSKANTSSKQTVKSKKTTTKKSKSKSRKRR